ncbi:GntR family transcriptional regulator [Kribbella sp. CA-293567]|uniref:GntR family transcriptional regulator n=1 Tax=Kribbella sp. CA-293567 TaxID=3002436 RepID=UPI0022DD9EAE|nr:substrate-binding domain-containing protein [Kribbella sp. CA-293567]WBQ03911.1 substrate-binding domain-containing protein [Kribbella sp. CA-293567]
MSDMTNEHGPDEVPRGMKFRTLAHQLREQILTGRWAVGDRLPTEPELARTHQVGINTVRRAVDLLIDDHLVARRQGAGTFVLAVPADSALQRRFVGVLVPSTSYFYPKVIEGIERVLSAAGVRVILSSSEYNLDREAEQTRQLLDAGVDGLLLVPNLHLMAEPDRYFEELPGLPVPYALIERRPPHPAPDDATPYVCTNHQGGAYAAVRHLVELGHRRIGHLGRHRTGTADAIHAGYERAIAEFGLPVLPIATQRREEWSSEELAAYTRTCVDNDVSAVFCLGDRDASALVLHARRLGLTVPDDLAIVAYDDEVADLGEVPLTAVSPPKAEVGALAAELLLRRLGQGETTPIPQVQLQPRLVIRASCGAESENRP